MAHASNNGVMALIHQRYLVLLEVFDFVSAHDDLPLYCWIAHVVEIQSLSAVLRREQKSYISFR
jgi:hypothetical protein